MKIALPLLTVLVIVFASACGSPAPSASATQPPASQPASVEPSATQPPAQPAATEASGTQVLVTLADNTIKSSLATFQAGVPYTFVITNSGRHAHNFNINPPVSVTGSLDDALTQALLSVPQKQLGIGATVTVEYTFPATAVGQQLEFSCLIKRHYEDGMLLTITVTQ